MTVSRILTGISWYRRLAIDLLFLLARALPRVPSDTFLTARHETLGVYLTSLLVALGGTLLLQLSSGLGMVQCIGGPIFLVPEIFGSLEWVTP